MRSRSRLEDFILTGEATPDQIVNASLESGIEVRPYTVNKESELERLFKVNCSAVITDDPAKAKRIREMQSAR